MTNAQAALAQVREALAKGSALVEWEWWTSNSLRRLSVRGDTVDGGVMHAYFARDGHPDISIRQDDMALIAACNPVNIAAILAHVDAQAAEIERLQVGIELIETENADLLTRLDLESGTVGMIARECADLRRQLDECSQMLARQAATIRDLTRPAGPRG